MNRRKWIGSFLFSIIIVFAAPDKTWGAAPMGTYGNSHKQTRAAPITLNNNFGVKIWSSSVLEGTVPVIRNVTQLIAKSPQARVDEAMRLNEEAVALYGAGRFAEAVPLAQRVLETWRAYLPRSHPNYVGGLSNLARLYQALGQYDAAEPLMVEALAIKRSLLPPGHPDLAFRCNNLASLYQDQGRFEAAEPLLREALEIRRVTRTADPSDLPVSLNNLAGLYYLRGRLDLAAAFFKEALDVARVRLAPGHINTADILSNLALVFEGQGRYSLAIRSHEEALSIRRARLRAGHPDIATSLNNIGGLFTILERYGEAERLHREALQIWRMVFDLPHPSIATSLKKLADVFTAQGRFAAAEPYLKDALWIFEASLAGAHPSIAVTMQSLAFVYREQARYAEAERLYKSALEMNRALFSKGHAKVARSLNHLALLYIDQGDYPIAERILQDAVDIARALGPGADRMLSVLLRNRAWAAWLQGHKQAAGRFIEEAVEIIRTHVEVGEVWTAGEGDEQQRLLHRETFQMHVEIAAESPAASTKMAFIAAQLMRRQETGRTLAAAAARFSQDDAGAVLARERQDMVQEWARLDERSLEALSTGKTKVLEEIQSRRRTLDAAFAANRRRLEEDFPRFADIAAFRVTELTDLQGADGLLRPGEALVLFVPGVETWHAFAVTQARALFVELDAALGDVAAKIARLRCALDRTMADQDAQALGCGARDPVSELRAFDLEAAHDLHEMLFTRLEPLIGDPAISDLLVVADGPLESLPLDILVRRRPEKGLTGDGAYGAAEWLVDRYSVSVLPSVSSLRHLRRDARSSAARAPLIAFGNPSLGSGGSDPLMTLSASGSSIDTVCDLLEVPATLKIGRALKEALRAPDNALVTGDQASEGRLRALNTAGVLKGARVLAFNTHGLLAGEVPAHAVVEPALVLTPGWPCGTTVPDPVDPRHDGLVTLSEVLELSLDADWALLTACNTAAADGSPGASPLSGLARGFFFAGARTLLVSHWPAIVAGGDPLQVGPTELLIRTLFNRNSLSATKAAALAAAKYSVRQRFPHPAYWAPFTLIGDGTRPVAIEL